MSGGRELQTVCSPSHGLAKFGCKRSRHKSDHRLRLVWMTKGREDQCRRRCHEEGGGGRAAFSTAHFDHNFYSTTRAASNIGTRVPGNNIYGKSELCKNHEFSNKLIQLMKRRTTRDKSRKKNNETRQYCSSMLQKMIFLP